MGFFTKSKGINEDEKRKEEEKRKEVVNSYKNLISNLQMNKNSEVITLLERINDLRFAEDTRLKIYNVIYSSTEYFKYVQIFQKTHPINIQEFREDSKKRLKQRIEQRIEQRLEQPLEQRLEQDKNLLDKLRLLLFDLQVNHPDVSYYLDRVSTNKNDLIESMIEKWRLKKWWGLTSRNNNDYPNSLIECYEDIKYNMPQFYNHILSEKNNNNLQFKKVKFDKQQVKFVIDDDDAKLVSVTEEDFKTAVAAMKKKSKNRKRLERFRNSTKPLSKNARRAATKVVKKRKVYRGKSGGLYELRRSKVTSKLYKKYLGSRNSN